MMMYDNHDDMIIVDMMIPANVQIQTDLLKKL